MLVTITKRQDKVHATMAKVAARLEKFKAMTLEQYAKKHKMSTDDMEHVKYWYGCDLRSIERQLKDNEMKLAEAKRLDQKESDRINKESILIVKRKEILDGLPEILKTFLADVIEFCYEDMLKKKARLEKRLQEHYAYGREHCELFNRGFKYRKEHEQELETLRERYKASRLSPIEQSLCQATDEQIRKDCVEGCENDVIDLVNRVYYKIGNIADCSGLHYQHNEINGVIRSNDGETVTVKSILAGGYNIQRLHIRTLVH